MRYIVTTFDNEGFHIKKSIEASSLTQDGEFLVFTLRKNIIMLAKDTIVSVCSDEYEPKEIESKPLSKTMSQAKIIKLYGLRK